MLLLDVIVEPEAVDDLPLLIALTPFLRELRGRLVKARAENSTAPFVEEAPVEEGAPDAVTPLDMTPVETTPAEIAPDASGIGRTNASGSSCFGEYMAVSVLVVGGDSDS